MWINADWENVFLLFNIFLMCVPSDTLNLHTSYLWSGWLADRDAVVWCSLLGFSPVYWSSDPAPPAQSHWRCWQGCPCPLAGCGPSWCTAADWNGPGSSPVEHRWSCTPGRVGAAVRGVTLGPGISQQKYWGKIMQIIHWINGTICKQIHTVTFVNLLPLMSSSVRDFSALSDDPMSVTALSLRYRIVRLAIPSRSAGVT